MAIHKLVFDTTDATTQAASSNVGAYVRSSDGTLIDSVTIATVDRLAVDATMKDGAGNALTSTGGALDVNLASGTITINEEDIFAEDAAHTTGDKGSHILAVRQDTLAASTSADGDYASFKVNNVGELYVTDEGSEAVLVTIDAVLDTIKTDTAAMVTDLAAIEVELLDQGTTLDAILADTANMDTNIGSINTTLTGLSHDEDTAHTTGDAGVMSLAVRNDTLAALADTDGDYAPFQVDADGALYVNVASSGTLTVNDAALANTAIANAANALDVANTAEDVVAAPLANRKYLFVYNNGNKEAYVGSTGVTSANGFPLPPGSILEMRAGASIDIEWVSADTNQELRTLELS